MMTRGNAVLYDTFKISRSLPVTSFTETVHTAAVQFLKVIYNLSELTEYADVNGPLRRVVLLVPGGAAVHALVGDSLHVLQSECAICNTLTDVCWQPHSICAPKNTSLTSLSLSS